MTTKTKSAGTCGGTTIEAVKSLRDLRKRADKSTAEIRKELVAWQKKLPRGKFKVAYLRAGWTESRIAHYLYGDRHKKKSAAQSRKLPDVQTHPEVVENKDGTQYAEVPDYVMADVSDEQTPEDAPLGANTDPYSAMRASINHCSQWAENGFPGAPVEILQGMVSDQVKMRATLIAALVKIAALANEAVQKQPAFASQTEEAV